MKTREDTPFQRVEVIVTKSSTKKRTAVERVNAYLKEYFQLNNICHRGALAKVDFEFACLTYTACKLTADRLNQSTKIKKSAA